MVGRQPSVRRRAMRSLRGCSRCMLRARAERGVISCCFASAKTTQDARRSRSCECFMTQWSYRAIFHRWTRWSPVGWVEERNPTSLFQSRPVGFRSSTQPTFFLEPCQEPLAACLVAGHALRASIQGLAQGHAALRPTSKMVLPPPRLV